MFTVIFSTAVSLLTDNYLMEREHDYIDRNAQHIWGDDIKTKEYSKFSICNRYLEQIQKVIQIFFTKEVEIYILTLSYQST